MKKKTSIALATAMLLSGGTVAWAAGMLPSAANDTLSLTNNQQKTAWNDLRAEATKQSAPSNFDLKVGSVVPSTLKIQPIPSRASSAVPALKPYDFAVLQGKLLIVNPSDRKIAEVITG
jgi:hypothetical protein